MRNRKYPVNGVDEAKTLEVRAIIVAMMHKMLLVVESRKPFNPYTVPLQVARLRVFAVKQKRGRAYYNLDRTRVITIPVWAFGRGDAYIRWYCAHELAHQYAHQYDGESGHEPAFMKWLKRVCPSDAIHYELTYKPRAAAAAGIRNPSGTK